MRVSPSILACDFANLQRECQLAVDAGADMLHIDVMDGVFVPNISIGPAVLGAIAKRVHTFYDVHLMIVKPQNYIAQFVESGANSITVHLESDCDVLATLKQIKEFGVGVGLSVKPGTPVQEVYPYLPYVDMVLIMSVEPGFGGQAFMEAALPKIAALSQFCRQNGFAIDIEVDGGINLETGQLCAEVGASVLVAGSSVFQSGDIKGSIAALQQLR